VSGVSRSYLHAEIADLRALLADALAPGRETSLVLTKMDEADLWLDRATMRDQADDQ
jgi:hypothetical protein